MLNRPLSGGAFSGGDEAAFFGLVGVGCFFSRSVEDPSDGRPDVEAAGAGAGALGSCGIFSCGGDGGCDRRAAV